MLKELLKNKEFYKIIKKYLKKPEILDILLFGSSIRGKGEAKDIDLLVIYAKRTKNVLELNHQLRKELEKISKNFQITGKVYDELFSPEFFAKEALLSESFSLKTKKFISESFGYKNFILFRYSLIGMNKTRRMRFYHGLYGRGKEKGILDKTNSYKFSDSIILSEIENSELIKSFLEKWQIKYLEFPVLIPKRILNIIKK